MSMTEKLAYIKKLRGLTTGEIARRSGIPVGTLNKIFSGQTRRPAVESMDRLAQVLRVPVHYLLDDELPPERCLSAAAEDALVLLSEGELRFLMEYRSLEAGDRREIEAMARLLRAPGLRLAGGVPVKRTFCCVPPPPGGGGPPCPLRPILIPETDPAVREADFAVLLPDGSMEPLYPAGAVLLCRREGAPRQDYGLFLLNRQALVRRFCRRRGRSKLVAPNVDFKDITVREEDSLEYLGRVAGCARGWRWG